MPLWIVLSLFVLLLPRLHAQSSVVPPGTRVRVQPPGGAAHTRQPCRAVLGRMLTATGDSLVIEDEQGEIRRIDLATARDGGSDEGLCGLVYVFTVPAGAALGTLVGALIRTERWEAVSEPTTSLHVWPLPTPATVSLEIHF